MTKICILLKLCTKHSLLETMQSIAKYFVPGPSPSPTASYEIENPVCTLNIVEAYLSQRLYPNNVSWSFRPSPPKCSPELFEKKRSNTLLFSPYFINNLPFWIQTQMLADARFKNFGRVCHLGPSLAHIQRIYLDFNNQHTTLSQHHLNTKFSTFSLMFKL